MIIDSNIKATEGELAKIGINLQKCQQDLTLPNPEYQNSMRFRKGRFFKPIPKYLCYLKKEGYNYVVPRYYNGEPSIMNGVVNGRTLNSECHIKLRDYQDAFITEHLETINTTTGLLLEAPCGHGKTLISLWLSYVRGVQTLIIVPTYYLANQWAQRIAETTTATCTIIKPTDKNVPTDSDFSIVVADLFTCRVLPKELIDNIGHVILDEAHRMGAETYMPILDEIPALYRTALTATFRRQDGMHQILKYHFGTHIKMGNRFPRPEIYAVKTSVEVNALISTKKVKPSFVDFLERNGVKYHETPNALSFQWDKELRDSADDLLHTGVLTKTAYREVCAGLKVSQEMQYPTLDSYLNDHAGRRKETIQLIQKCLDAGRTILFLSKRKDTLRALHKYFEKYKPMLIVSETNARSEEDENYLQKDCRLIFGVTQLAKEGLDIDRLDTLIIHLPMKDTEQAVGRISRIHPTKQKPICFYLLDQCPITYAVYSNAKKYFKINGEFKGEIKLRQVPQVLE